MKPVYFVLIFFTLASAETELETWRIINTQDINVDLNKIVDKFNPYIQKFMITHGLDPVNLPDAVTSVGKGRLSLSNGVFNGLSHVKRYDNATLLYNGKQLKMDIGFEFNSLEASYNNYVFKYSIFTSKGRITASVGSLRAKVSTILNTANYTLTLNNLKIESLDNIKIKVHSKLGLGWIYTPIINAALPRFKSEITRVIEVELADTIQKYFNEINSITRKMLANILEYELVERYLDKVNDVSV